MTRRERQIRREWCDNRVEDIYHRWQFSIVSLAELDEIPALESELRHYARQDRRRAKRRNTK